MKNKLETIKKRYEELSACLMDPLVMSDFNKVKTLSKEQSDLKEVVDKYEELLLCEKNLNEAKSLMNDPDFKEMAELEIEENNQKITEINAELEILLRK